MDELYSDIDNYNEVNVISELRNENMELKSKLEECTIIMENLQKDYDRVSSEFKKLEINYSSLLKTAKAEIERKTQIITNLNVEKDMMVLNSIQNRNNFSFRRDLVDRNNKYSRHTDSDWSKHKGRKDEVPDLNQRTYSDSKGKGEKRLPSEDTTTTNNTESVHRLNYSDRKPTHFPVSSKENAHASKESDPIKSEIKASSIRNRRKSMPVSNSVKFSSDDESEDVPKCDSAKEDIKKHRGFDKHGYESSCRRRHNESDRYHKRGRHDTSRLHRPLSSDRSKERRRPTKGSEDNYHRRDSRRRTPGSPLPSNHNKHRSSRDMRFDKPYDYERSSHRHGEKIPVKHKLEEYDAPTSKRVKTEDRPYSDNLRCQKDKHLVPNMEHQSAKSCQSPDYMLLDSLASQPIKEIKLQATEETILDDPRTLSNRYIISDNVKNIRSAATGINVDIIPLKKTAWGTDIVPTPDALKPMKYNDQFVKDIYTGIDDPISNMSIESGAISDSDISNAPSHISSINSDPRKNSEEIYSKNKKTDPTMAPLCIPNLQEGTQDSHQDRESDTTNENQTQKAAITKYRIPKIKPDNKGDNRIKSLDAKSNNIENINSYDQSKCNPANESRKNKKKQESLQDPHISKAIVANDLELSDEGSDCAEIEPVTKDVEIKKNPELYCSKELPERSKKQESRKKSHKKKNTSSNSNKRSPQETVERKAVDKAESQDLNNSSSKLFDKEAGGEAAHNGSENFNGESIENKSGNIASLETSDCVLKDSNGKFIKNKAESHHVQRDSNSKFIENKADDKANLQSSKDSNSKYIENKETHGSNESNSKITNKPADKSNLQSSKNSNSQYIENKASDTVETQHGLRHSNSEFKDSSAGDKETHHEPKDSNNIGSKDNKKTCHNSQDDNTKSVENKAGVKKAHGPKDSSNNFIESKAENKTEIYNFKKSPKTEEKKRSKKDSNQVHSKYSDLFGDSSLISPEDLGINSEKSQTTVHTNYIPICEDAIDSSDICTDKFEDKTKPIVHAAVDCVTSDADIDKMTDNGFKKNDPTEEVYKNIVAADLKESDVVKTIIISTGLQPDVVDPPIKSAPLTENELEYKPKQKEIFSKVQEASSSLKALATSTPHKNANENCQIGSNMAVVNPNDSKDTCNNKVESKTASEQNEKDAPDVRIFIKRRRKVIKTATPSKN